MRGSTKYSHSHTRCSIVFTSGVRPASVESTFSHLARILLIFTYVLTPLSMIQYTEACP